MTTKYLPRYSYTFDIERSFSYEWGRTFLIENTWIPITAITVYLTMIVTGRYLMKDRKPFKLTQVLFYWNLALAAFSIMGSIRSIPEFYHVATKFGLNHTICQQKPSDGVYSFWCAMFISSKIIELGDTLFIVARKQPLMFLHWFHHVTVLIFGWWSSMGPLGFGRYIMTMNFFVHSLMYSYYAARIKKIPVPKPLAMTITLLQIAQMFGGVFVTIYAFIEVTAGRECQITPTALNMSIVCYGSYLVLFIRFFIASYFGKSAKKSEPRDSNANIKKID